MTRSRVIVGGAVVVGLVVLTVWLYVSAVRQQGTADVVGFQRTRDETKIVVIVTAGYGTDVVEREVREDAASVRITVHVRTGAVVPFRSPGITMPVVVSLKGPLGSRAVLDQNGNAVVDRGTYELPSAAPTR